MSQIAAFSPVDPSLVRGTENRFSEMSTEDFIKVIFTELSNQDPFQPNDSAALLEQLDSIRSIESDMNLVAQLKTLVLESQLASASNLIGKTVSGLSQDLERVSGAVISVLRQGSDVLLELDSGHRVPVDSIEAIEL